MSRHLAARSASHPRRLPPDLGSDLLARGGWDGAATPAHLAGHPQARYLGEGMVFLGEGEAYSTRLKRLQEWVEGTIRKGVPVYFPGRQGSQLITSDANWRPWSVQLRHPALRPETWEPRTARIAKKEGFYGD